MSNRKEELLSRLRNTLAIARSDSSSSGGAAGQNELRLIAERIASASRPAPSSNQQGLLGYNQQQGISGYASSNQGTPGYASSNQGVSGYASSIPGLSCYAPCNQTGVSGYSSYPGQPAMSSVSQNSLSNISSVDNPGSAYTADRNRLENPVRLRSDDRNAYEDRLQADSLKISGNLLSSRVDEGVRGEGWASDAVARLSGSGESRPIMHSSLAGSTVSSDRDILSGMIRDPRRDSRLTQDVLEGDARLGDARLGDARLSDARLGDARLGNARLGDARLSDARLGDVRLGDARLGDARLSDARLGDARLGGVRDSIQGSMLDSRLAASIERQRLYDDRYGGALSGYSDIRGREGYVDIRSRNSYADLRGIDGYGDLRNREGYVEGRRYDSGGLSREEMMLLALRRGREALDTRDAMLDARRYASISGKDDPGFLLRSGMYDKSRSAMLPRDLLDHPVSLNRAPNPDILDSLTSRRSFEVPASESLALGPNAARYMELMKKVSDLADSTKPAASEHDVPAKKQNEEQASSRVISESSDGRGELKGEKVKGKQGEEGSEKESGGGEGVKKASDTMSKIMSMFAFDEGLTKLIQERMNKPDESKILPKRKPNILAPRAAAGVESGVSVAMDTAPSAAAPAAAAAATAAAAAQVSPVTDAVETNVREGAGVREVGGESGGEKGIERLGAKLLAELEKLREIKAKKTVDTKSTNMEVKKPEIKQANSAGKGTAEADSFSDFEDSLFSEEDINISATKVEKTSKVDAAVKEAQPPVKAQAVSEVVSESAEKLEIVGVVEEKMEGEGTMEEEGVLEQEEIEKLKEDLWLKSTDEFLERLKQGSSFKPSPSGAGEVKKRTSEAGSGRGSYENEGSDAKKLKSDTSQARDRSSHSKDRMSQGNDRSSQASDKSSKDSPFSDRVNSKESSKRSDDKQRFNKDIDERINPLMSLNPKPRPSTTTSSAYNRTPAAAKTADSNGKSAASAVKPSTSKTALANEKISVDKSEKIFSEEVKKASDIKTGSDKKKEEEKAGKVGSKVNEKSFDTKTTKDNQKESTLKESTNKQTEKDTDKSTGKDTSKVTDKDTKGTVKNEASKDGQSASKEGQSSTKQTPRKSRFSDSADPVKTEEVKEPMVKLESPAAADEVVKAGGGVEEGGIKGMGLKTKAVVVDVLLEHRNELLATMTGLEKGIEKLTQSRSLFQERLDSQSLTGISREALIENLADNDKMLEELQDNLWAVKVAYEETNSKLKECVSSNSVMGSAKPQTSSNTSAASGESIETKTEETKQSAKPSVTSTATSKVTDTKTSTGSAGGTAVTPKPEAAAAGGAAMEEQKVRRPQLKIVRGADAAAVASTAVLPMDQSSSDEDELIKSVESRKVLIPAEKGKIKIALYDEKKSSKTGSKSSEGSQYKSGGEEGEDKECIEGGVDAGRLKEVIGVAMDMYKKAELFYDGGSLWCRKCSDVLTCVPALCKHLHSDKHQQAVDPDCDDIYKATPAPVKNPSSKPSAPARGNEFIMPLQSFFCSLCCEFLKDSNNMKIHVLSNEHNNRFKTFLTENPNYEQQYLCDKMTCMLKLNSTSQPKSSANGNDSSKKSESKSSPAKTISGKTPATPASGKTPATSASERTPAGAKGKSGASNVTIDDDDEVTIVKVSSHSSSTSSRDKKHSSPDDRRRSGLADRKNRNSQRLPRAYQRNTARSSSGRKRRHSSSSSSSSSPSRNRSSNRSRRDSPNRSRRKSRSPVASKRKSRSPVASKRKSRSPVASKRKSRSPDKEKSTKESPVKKANVAKPSNASGPPTLSTIPLPPPPSKWEKEEEKEKEVPKTSSADTNVTSSSTQSGFGYLFPSVRPSSETSSISTNRAPNASAAEQRLVAPFRFRTLIRPIRPLMAPPRNAANIARPFPSNAPRR